MMKIKVIALIFDVINNIWITDNNDEKDYLNDCLPNFASLNIEYDNSLNEYLLYCEQNANKYNVVKLDNIYYDIKDEEENRFYKIDVEQFSNCNELSKSSLVRDSNNKNLIKILINCDNNIVQSEMQESSKEITTTILNIITTVSEVEAITPSTSPSTITPTSRPVIVPTSPPSIFGTTPPTITPIISLIESTIPLIPPLIETTIFDPSTSSIPVKVEESKYNENNINIFQANSSKTKEEIINNLKECMENYDLKNIYEIFGDDYKIKISPINNQLYKNISTYVNFTNCEKKLREHPTYSSSNFSLFQIELYNLYENTLVN